MGIRFITPGMFTTVQDEGRIGFQKYGVSPSGPMDARSFHIANLLTGNRREQGALELTMLGPTLLFTQDEVIAITGACMNPSVNGKRIPMYAAVQIHAGEQLKFGVAVNGLRTYIAFAGGLDLPLVMNSQATLAQKKLGGFRGRKLEKGDEIHFTAPVKTLPKIEKRALPKEEWADEEVIARVVTGPQEDAFSREELRKFFWYDAEITVQSDRQGIRLKREEPLHHLVDGNIISDGISFGAIQVPTDGQPIIMMADRQTVGGYTKIGNVISVDLPKVAQARPGMRIRFIHVSIELAQRLYKKEWEELNALEKQLNC